MKTNSIILVLFAMLFACGHTQAQDDLPYRPLQAFRKDTIRYLDYNFRIRGDLYADKTVGELIHDLEFPVVYISKLVMQFNPIENKTISGLIAMNLVIRLVGDGDWDDSKDYYIGIRLKTPVNADDFFDALNRDKRNKEKRDDMQCDFFYWTPQLYELLQDRKLEGTIANDCLFPDRRKLHETNTWEDFEKLRRVIETEKAKWRNKIRAERQVVNEILPSDN